MSDADPRERLIDHALGRLHRGAADPDLADRVATAWERGVQGPALDDLPEGRSDLPAAERGIPPHPTRRPGHLLAAAALVAALLGVWILRPFGARDDRVVARLSRPLPQRIAGTWSERDSLALESGTPVWVDGFAPALLHLPDGGVLAVQPATRFTVEGDARGARVRLDWGALEASAGTRELELVADEARVTLAPGASVGAELAWDRPGPAPSELSLIEAARLGMAGGCGRLRVARIAGSSTFAGPKGAITVPPQGPIALALDGRGPHPLDLKAGRELGELFEKALDAGEPKSRWLVPSKADHLLYGTVLDTLAAEPAHWIDFAPRVRQVLATPLGARERGRILTLLTASGSRPAIALAEELWIDHPADFHPDHLVALAELGHPVFAEEVRGIVLHTDPAEREEPWVDPKEWKDPLLPAAFLALRGDDLGVAVLLRTARGWSGLAELKPFDGSAVIASAALAAGGLDAEPWRGHVAELERVAREYLAQGALEEAAWMALLWEALQEGVREPERFRLGHLELRLTLSALQRMETLAKPDAIAALLAELGR